MVFMRLVALALLCICTLPQLGCTGNDLGTCLVYHESDIILNNASVDCLVIVPMTSDGTPTGKPECVVGYVDASNPHATPASALPVCSAKCCNYFATDPMPNLANDPNQPMPNPHLVAELAACMDQSDCYCAVPSTVNCTTGVVAGLWRKGGSPVPAGKVITFRCGNVAGCGGP